MNEMLINNEPIQVQKKSYAAPVIIDSGGMTFTREVWEEHNDGNWAFQCVHCKCGGHD